MTKENDLRGKPLGEILQALFKIPSDAIAPVLAGQAGKGGRIGELLLAANHIDTEQLAEALAAQVGRPFVDEINVEEVPENLLRKLPIAFSKQKQILPVGHDAHGRVQLAMVDPFDLTTLDQLRMLFKKEVTVSVVSPETLFAAVNRSYDRAMQHAEKAVAELEEGVADDGLGGDLEEEVVDLLDMDGDDEAPIIRLVNTLFSQAVKDRASDIHIEPFEKELVVRFRVDGILYEIIRPPKRFQNSIVSRVKIMADLNIAEKRLPQDGRIRLKVAGKDFDIRVSTVPTNYGERIVMRLLDRSSIMKDLSDIGFSEKTLKETNDLIRSSHGIFLVTGPTGSGKTSTLYGCLSKINRPDLNILTVEDPVEYQLAGVGQVQVNQKINLTFATGLRAFLRQDPDVIMVGEIRDQETAEIAIQASLTGHLVFSTIHTNDAPGAVTRLIDMHVEPFLVASSLIGVLAQRLVRTICQNCKESYSPGEEALAQVGIDATKVKEVFRGKGCKKCQNTGYLGRIGIFEMMTMDDDIRQLVVKKSDAATIKTVARIKGMVTLREDGADKIVKGITTLEEVTRVTRDDTQVSGAA